MERDRRQKRKSMRWRWNRLGLGMLTGPRHTEDLYEVMRSVENRLGTITSLRWTEDGAWVSLRTSRAYASYRAHQYVATPLP